MLPERKALNNMGIQPRILFVGDDWYGSNTTSLRNAFLRRGCDVLSVDTRAVNDSTLLRRVAGRLFDSSLRNSPTTVTDFNERLLRLASSWRPDILFVNKGLLIEPQTLEAMTSVTKVHYHPDDCQNPDNQSAQYLSTERLYDLLITTKSFNVAELLARGAKRAEFLWCAYDRDWHVPSGRAASTTTPFDFDVAFVGTRRSDRIGLVHDLAARFGDRFSVTGHLWERDRGLDSRAHVSQPVYGHDMAAIIARSASHLGLVAYRDLHTCRTFEIPACGGLILAERTTEHEQLFEDGVTALLFSNLDELLDAITRVQRYPDERARLAKAGYEHITRGGNTYEDRVDTMLAMVR